METWSHGDRDFHGLDRNSVNSDKFKGIIDFFATLEIQLDNFASTFYQRIDVLCMSVTAMQRGERGKLFALVIALNQNRKFSFCFHRRFHLIRYRTLKQKPTDPSASEWGGQGLGLFRAIQE